MMRTLRVLHRWIGLLLALPLLLQAASGVVLAIEPVITGAMGPHLARTAPDGPLSVGPMVAAARAAAPPGAMPMLFLPPDGPHAPAVVRVAPPQRRAEQTEILVDPVTAEVVGTRAAWRGFIGTVHLLHEHLLMPQWNGRSVVGWIGVGLLLLGLSGLPLWWPRPGGLRAAVTVQRRARGWRFQRQLHGAVGIWSLGMMLLMAATGVTLAFPQTFRAWAGEAGGPGGGGRGGRGDGPATPPDLDAVLARAQAAVPGARLVALRLPLPGQPVGVTLAHADAADGAPAVSVQVDPSGARVLSMQDPRTKNTGAWTLAWSRSLHFGEGLGPVWRGLVMASALALGLFSVTGVAMWLLRHRNRRRMAQQRVTALQEAAE